MAKKTVYVCFDYERDKHYKYLMEAWDANPDFEFTFNDRSPREIQSNDISVIKACLTKKIKEAKYTVVLAGKDANKSHPDAAGFGFLLSNPQTLTQCANQYILDSYGIQNEILNFSILHTGIIYLLLWFVLQYYQVCLTIEKWYCYIVALEKSLVEKGEIISREGESYADSYPLLKNVANVLYAWCIPLGVGTIATFRSVQVLKITEGNVLLDFLGLMLILILSLLYFSDRNLNWKSWKENVGLCNKIRGFVRLDV